MVSVQPFAARVSQLQQLIKLYWNTVFAIPIIERRVFKKTANLPRQVLQTVPVAFKTPTVPCIREKRKCGIIA